MIDPTDRSHPIVAQYPSKVSRSCPPTHEYMSGNTMNRIYCVATVLIVCVSIKTRYLCHLCHNDTDTLYHNTHNTISRFATGCRRPIGCLKLQVIFLKRATHRWALLRKTTCKDKASYVSSPPCICVTCATLILTNSIATQY